MLSGKLLCLGLDKRNSHSLSFQRHQLSRVLLSPAFSQLLHGWFLHNPHVFHVSQTQAGTVPEVRKCVTGLGAMLLGLVVWIWCQENSALNLPGLLCIQLVQTEHITGCYCVSKSAFLYMYIPVYA